VGEEYIAPKKKNAVNSHIENGYDIDKKGKSLGSGMSGTVWKGRDLSSNTGVSP
jgi:hypothetical protein